MIDQTTATSFTDIFGRNEFSCKQALSNSFYFVSGFLTLLGKINSVQTNGGDDHAEHALKTNLACIFLEHFLFIKIIER